MTVFVLLSIVMGQPAAPQAAAQAWQALYDAGGDGGYVASVWLNDDGTWRAGGKDEILSGSATGIVTTPVPGHTALAFTADETGKVLAAGNNLAIWEERDGRFRLVAEKSGPRVKGRAALGDELLGFARLDPTHPRRLFAYGLERILVRDGAASAWEPLNDPALIHDANFGPASGPPAGCHALRWHQLAARDGLLQCHEGSAFLYRGDSFSSIGRVPPGCVQQGVRAALDGERLVMACGRQTSRIWVRRAEGQPWNVLPSTAAVRDLSARKGCVLVATRRAVLRWCEAASTGP